MNSLDTINRNLTALPLRLILTTQCYGHCNFCHKEGSNGNCMQIMSQDMALNAACCAEKLAIPSICLTGGEPTLYPQLPELISKIQKKFTGNVCITTNGNNLKQCLTGFSEIHTINLSLISFNPEISKNYQDVDPKSAFDSLLLFPAKNKNLNIVVTEDNYIEIKNIIDMAIKMSVSVDIMFVLKEYDDKDIKIHNNVINLFNEYGTPYIKLSSTPEAVIDISSTCHIRMKHPILSRMIKRNVCNLMLYNKT